MLEKQRSNIFINFLMLQFCFLQRNSAKPNSSSQRVKQSLQAYFDSSLFCYQFSIGQNKI